MDDGIDGCSGIVRDNEGTRASQHSSTLAVRLGLVAGLADDDVSWVLRPVLEVVLQDRADARGVAGLCVERLQAPVIEDEQLDLAEALEFAGDAASPRDSARSSSRRGKRV